MAANRAYYKTGNLAILQRMYGYRGYLTRSMSHLDNFSFDHYNSSRGRRVKVQRYFCYLICYRELEECYAHSLLPTMRVRTCGRRACHDQNRVAGKMSSTATWLEFYHSS